MPPPFPESLKPRLWLSLSLIQMLPPQLLSPAPMAIPPPKPIMPLLPLLPIRKPPLPPKHITPTLMPRVSKAGRETIPTASMTTAIRAWCQQASMRATHARIR